MLKKLIFSMFFVSLFFAIDIDIIEASENGWKKENGYWYYYESGELKKGWLEYKGKWYYLNRSSGEMETGWIYDNAWYFLDPYGAMRTGWIRDNNKWYFLNKYSGEMETGWVYDNAWYFLGSNGVMRIGWVWNNSNWYFLNRSSGKMETGWIYDNAWYFLGPNGAMKTGWVWNNSNWYFLNRSSGKMETGWIYDHAWYFLDPYGAMKTGWIYYNYNWYLLDQNGAMKTGWVEDNGKLYFLFDDGKMAKNTSISTHPSDLPINNFSTLGDSKQVILVTSKGYETYKARVQSFEKVNGRWVRLFDVPGYIGKYGFAVTMREGAMKSPRGKYTIGTAFGRYNNPGTKLPYRKITSDDVWVDDPKSPLYNTWQKKSANNGRWKSAENMNIPAYNYGFVINYNTIQRIPYAGSAIFFHVATNYTAGCTGVSQENVINFLKWLDPKKQPIIIQAPENELGNY